MVPVLGMLPAALGKGSDVDHHFSLAGARFSNLTLLGSSGCLFQVSATRLDNMESWGGELLLPVIHGLPVPSAIRFWKGPSSGPGDWSPPAFFKACCT